MMAAEIEIEHLPLSWARLPTLTIPQFTSRRLRLSGYNWIPTAELPCDWSFNQIFVRHLQPQQDGWILQFCPASVARFVVAHGGEALQIGVEGILSLTKPMDKPSLLALARRGSRHGTVQEVANTPAHQRQLAHLGRQTPHSNKPQLTLAFRTQFDKATRCFVLKTPQAAWLAAITLSTTMRGAMHTEMMLRDKNAPVGVMEALLVAIYHQLQAEGYHTWSLGAVPFMTRRRLTVAGDESMAVAVATATMKTQVLTGIGRNLRFAYDYRGLMQFKDKFQPVWQPLYLCGKPKLPWPAMADLAYQMRYLHLIGNSFRRGYP